MLLPKAREGLPGTQLLTEQLLAERSLLLRCRHALTKSLSTDTEHLLRGLLNRGTIRLFSPKSQLLLLLSGRERLSVTLLQQVRCSLSGRQVLLLSQYRLRNTATLTTECSGPDLLTD